MISSKLTSTLLRKISPLVFLLFLIITPLFASDEVNVAIYSDSDIYASLLTDVISIFEDDASSPYLYELVSERLERKSNRDYLKSRDSYLNSENFTSLESLKREEREISELKLRIVDNKLSSSELEALYSGNREATDYIRLRDDLDLIVVAKATSAGQFWRIDLFINGDKVRTTLFSAAFQGTEEESLLSILASVLLDDATKLYKLDLPKESVLLVDGRRVPLYAGAIPLKNGEHELIYSAPGYKAGSATFNADGSDRTIALNFVEKSSAPLLFDIVPYNSELFLNGDRLDERLALSVKAPFTVTAQSDDFALYSAQRSKETNRLEITLHPEWMNGESVIAQRKDTFYKRLFMTLMAFGAYVGLESAANIYANSDAAKLLSPLSVVAEGLSVVFLLSDVEALFSYYQASRMGI